jgi:protein-S-isoprenylcysteine O-methyltransferase Ste14
VSFAPLCGYQIAVLTIFLKNILFLLVAPTSVTILSPWLLLKYLGGHLAFDIGAAKFIGIPLIILGAAIYLWCDWNFAVTGKATPAPIDAPKVLVVNGLFTRVRNPFYIGIVTVLIGEAILFQSGVLLIFAAVMWAAFHSFVMFYEEPHLRKTFGASYAEYCKKTPRWIPRF